MNSYGNTYGFHTPEKTEEYIKKLNADIKGIRFADYSWHNDLTDSCGNYKRDIQVMFPNSEVHDPENEKFNWFAIYFNREKELAEEVWKNFQTIEEVIEMVQQYVIKFDNRDKDLVEFIKNYKDMELC